jgi:hypothetical protein
MKKVLFSSLFIILLFNKSIAQDFGVQLGINMAHMHYVLIYENKEKEILTSNTTGINIGINYDIELSENLYFEPGLFYSSKGYVINDKDEQDKLKLSYLDFPLLIKYKTEIGDDLFLIGKFGPSVSMGVGGSYSECEDTDCHTDNVQFVNVVKEIERDTEYFRPFDYGINFGVGATYNNFEFGFNYYLGLNDIGSDYKFDGTLYEDDDVFRHRVFSINLGYRFNN